jgi:hypothetical protein
MSDRTSHANLQSNPRAVYSSRRKGGTRASGLPDRIGEEKDSPQIAALRRRSDNTQAERTAEGPRFLVWLRIDRIRPLVGKG